MPLETFGSAGNAVDWTGLQWTKLGRGATLQCNVDRLEQWRPNNPDPPIPSSDALPIKREIPWICICAASAS